MALARFVLLFVVFLSVLQVALFYGDLPDVMASHFDGAGTPNGWSSKSVFFAIAVGAMLLTVGTFAGVPIFMRKLPTRRINMPHKDYWMAPERREETLEVFESHFLWLGVIHGLLVLIILQMVIDANLRQGETVLTSAIWWPLIIYAVLFTGWFVTFLRRFRLPKAARAT